MKLYDCVWVLWAVVVVVAPQKTSAAGKVHLDYTMTLPEDPLQPVWDRLESISQEVLTGLQLQMTQYLRKTQDNLESLSLKISALEDKLDSSISNFRSQIMEEIADQLTSMETNVREKLSVLSGRITLSSDTLVNISSNVIRINEKVSGIDDVTSSGDINNCTVLVDRVGDLMNEQQLIIEGQTANGSQVAENVLDEETVQELRSAVAQLRESPAFLPRDCSDLHWHQPQSPSGVFQTYPTMDPKMPVAVWCDMGQNATLDDGGWTVILRRQNTSWGLIDFNRTWSEYRAGFGMPGEGEWWYGLASLHALTYRQPYEVHFLMHDMELGYYDACYTTFRVEDEGRHFRLIVDGFSGNVTYDAFKSRHNGQPFSTKDVDQDDWIGGNCAANNGGGWWYQRCHRTSLTATFPTSSDRAARTIRWLARDWLVLDDVTVKIRPSTYGLRFDSHSYSN
ncbi:fibrinogen C domain-containing protein 1-A-like [Panulirus ornatus]|uniref:fibrinogen C domain-containing protein 1-A-like n=1 Tax=Panulirus ornatus TaxID=150431 RepID=UPI003A8C2CEF